MSEFLRFFTVTVLGVILDIAIAYTLAAHFGVPLWIAAAIGFVIAACINYVVHQLWSFQDGSRRLSLARAAKYGGTALVTLAARVAVVAALDSAMAGKYPLLILIGGAGVSFFVNFGLSKFFVFSEKPQGAGAP
jgi:putative flippase GtrA